MTVAQRMWLFLFKATQRIQWRVTGVAGSLATIFLNGLLSATYCKRVHYQILPSPPDRSTRRWTQEISDEVRLTIVVVTYRQPIALNCLLASLQCQTLQNFDVIVIHDGVDNETKALVARYESIDGNRIKYLETSERFNDFGHSLRDLGIVEATGEFLLITNGDNYFAPRLVEYVFDGIGEHALDIVMWNMVHSHSNPGTTKHSDYSPFSVCPVRMNFDIGTFISKTALAKAVGFRDKSHDGDATYFEDLLLKGGGKLRIGKIEKTLMMHN